MSKQLMRMRLVSFWLFAALMLSVLVPSVSAQLPPRISPWMHMFDRQDSPLGNYLGTVRPQQDLMRAHAAQSQQIQAQQRALQALQSGGGNDGGAGTRNLAAGGGGAAGSGASSAAGMLSPPREVPRANRNPAGFNQYLHYYPPGSMPRQPVPNFSPTGRR